MSIVHAPQQDRATAARRPYRAAALACVAAGVLGLVSGAVLALADPVVDDDRFSYPLSAAGFVAAQVWFAFHHLGLLAGLLALGRSGVLGRSLLARRGWQLAVAGMVGLTLTELVAIVAADDRVDAGAAPAVGALYGVDCLALGVGLVVAGAVIARAGTWSGWQRWVVLGMGVWVFVPMFPALVLTPTDGARWAIGGWMLLFGLLGAALAGHDRHQAGRAR